MNPSSGPDSVASGDRLARFFTRSLTRRHALYCGAGTLAVLGGIRSFWDMIKQLGRDEAPAEVFKADAPGEALWKLWCERG